MEIEEIKIKTGKMDGEFIADVSVDGVLVETFSDKLYPYLLRQINEWLVSREEEDE